MLAIGLLTLETVNHFCNIGGCRPSPLRAL